MEISDSIPVIAVTMMLLAVIQSFYQPAVQASVPLLATKNNLVKANAIVSQVNGSFLVTIYYPINEWMVGHILSFGNFIEIVEPNEAKKLIKERARLIFNIYDEKL